jgi:hypothetical protein
MWPSYTSGLWVPFSSPLTRYFNPPPYGYGIIFLKNTVNGMFHVTETVFFRFLEPQIFNASVNYPYVIVE